MKSPHIMPLLILVFAGMAFTQNTLPKDSDGWTIFHPQDESRILYVSSSTGNDQTALTYSKSSPEVGNDPFLPGNVKPFKTIAAAYAAARDKQPDWILLKRGDVWYEPLQKKNGLSVNAPFLVASYGTGTDRPLLKTGTASGIDYCCKDFNNVAFVDIDFYAHTRNPDSNEYTGPEGHTGFNFYVGEGFTGTGLLIEGCRFRFYLSNVIQGPGTLKDIVIRRCVILDNYCTTAHSQGLYTSNVSITLEENVFDHNGWYKQQIDGGNEKEEGQATMFNHNTYFSGAHEVIFRKNIFLRPSSIGNKWTANSGEASARNITIDNNLYVDGEIGISMGGNESDPPYRFKNIRITNNVMLDMGQSQPTNRTLGWYLEINDWDDGVVSNNYFLHKMNPVVGNVYAMNLIGQTRNVRIDSNTMYGINANGQLLSIEDGGDKSNISFSGNTFHNENQSGRLIKANGSLQNYSFSSNRYFSTRSDNQWFEISKTPYTGSGWFEQSGESNAVIGAVQYYDPNRKIDSYMSSLGYSPTFSAFIEEVRKQCKSNWREDFTAATVNKWIKDGFSTGMTNMLDKNIAPSVKSTQPENISYYKVFSLSGQYYGDIKHIAELKKFSRGVVIVHPVFEDLGLRTGKALTRLIR